MEDEIVIPWSDISGEGPATTTPPVTVKPENPPAETLPAVTTETVPAASTTETLPETSPAGNEPQEIIPGVETEEATAPGKQKQHRLRPNDETEALAFEMMRSAQKANAPLSLKDALAKAEAITKPETSAPAATEDPLKAIDEELATVAATLDKDAEDGSLNTPEYRKAQRRESELLAKKATLVAQQAQAAEQAAQAKEAQFTEAEDRAWGEAKAKFSDLENPNSELAKRVAEKWNAIADDPSHPLYTLPNLPKILVLETADELGIAPKAATPTAPAPPAKPGTLPLQPVPGSAGRTVTPIAPTEAQKEALFTQNLAKASDDEAMKAVLGADLYGGNAKSDAWAFR